MYLQLINLKKKSMVKMWHGLKIETKELNAVGHE